MTQVSCESRDHTWALGPGPRVLDVTLGIPLLLLGLIPMAVIALALLLTQGRPVLFVQCRLGRGERTFTLHKFRTLPAGQRVPGSSPLPIRTRRQHSHPGCDKRGWTNYRSCTMCCAAP